jgi:hypothetical protein
MKQLHTMTDAELQTEAQETRLTSRSTTAQRDRAVFLLDELARRLARRIVTQQIGCSPEKCEYPFAIGLQPGVDVSIDGDVWPGSAFDRHLDTCPTSSPRIPRSQNGTPA